MRKLGTLLTFALFASLCVSAGASECEYEAQTKGQSVEYRDRSASCVISQSVILGNYCEKISQQGFCDVLTDVRLLQILHPDLGYLDCSIEYGTTHTNRPFGQRVVCYSYEHVIDPS